VKTTDGNLEASCTELEEADYIVCAKSFDGGLPNDGGSPGWAAPA